MESMAPAPCLYYCSHILHQGFTLSLKITIICILANNNFLRFLQALAQLRTAPFLSSHLEAAAGTGLPGSTAKSSPDNSWGGVVQGEEEANSLLSVIKSTVRIQEFCIHPLQVKCSRPSFKYSNRCLPTSLLLFIL